MIFSSEDKLNTACAVQSPSDDGGESEAAHGHGGEDGYPASISGGEAGDGQLCASCLSVSGPVTPTAQDNQSGQCTDQNGIGKYLKDAEEYPALPAFLVSAQAWAMEPVPRPASLEKIPRDTPRFMLVKKLPITPPVTACGWNAPSKIMENTSWNAVCVKQDYAKGQQDVKTVP